MIDWKRKLTSRKFWAAIIGFVTAIVTVFAVPNITGEQVQTVGWALGALIAYIIGEGLTDALKKPTETYTDYVDEEPTNAIGFVDTNESAEDEECP